MAKKDRKKIVVVVEGNRRNIVNMDGKYLYLADGTKMRILDARIENIRNVGLPSLNMERLDQAIRTEPQE